MQWDELLKACSLGKLPKVQTSKIVDELQTGYVSVIDTKNSRCAIRFDGMNDDEWFYAFEQEDVNTRYLVEIEFTN